MVRKVALIAATFAAAGCVAIDYKAPVTGDIAFLRVTTEEQGYNYPVRAHEDGTCDRNHFKTIGLLNSRMVGTKWQPDVQTQLQANKPINISVAVGGPDEIRGRTLISHWCEPIFRITPRPNKFYSVVFVSAGDRCDVKVSESSGSFDGADKVDIAVDKVCDLPSPWK